MQPIDILDFSLERLRRDGVSLADVHRQTGLGQTWLSQLRSGKIPNPTVTKIQVLANYFARIEAKEESAPAAASVGITLADRREAA